jgi:hypothetical protein
LGLAEGVHLVREKSPVKFKGTFLLSWLVRCLNVK